MLTPQAQPDGESPTATPSPGGQSPQGTATAHSVPAVSRAESAVAIRRNLWTRVLWGCYNPVATVSGPIFCGFALWMGLGAPQIALLVSLSSLVGLAQPLLLIIEHRIHRKKAFIVGAGLCEITFTMSVIAIPVLLPPGNARVVGTVSLVLLGGLMGNLVSPLIQGWVSQMVPADIRGKTISKWVTAVTAAAAVFGYAAGYFLDTFQPEALYKGFLIVFLAGWITGVGGYLIVWSIRYPGGAPVGSKGMLERAAAPFRNKNFVWYLLVTAFWHFGSSLSVPFLSVFMLNDLKISFSAIAILNNLSMAVLIVGYQFWGRLADRYGSHPILRISMVLRFVIPLLWACTSAAVAPILLPVIMIVQGVAFSGLVSANNPFLYKLASSVGRAPESERRGVTEDGRNAAAGHDPATHQGEEGETTAEGIEAATGFFAVWSAICQLAAATASAIAAGIVKAMEGHSIGMAGFEIGGLRLVFILSALAVIVPNVLLRKVEDPGASTVRELLTRKRR